MRATIEKPDAATPPPRNAAGKELTAAYFWQFHDSLTFDVYEGAAALMDNAGRLLAHTTPGALAAAARAGLVPTSQPSQSETGAGGLDEMHERAAERTAIFRICLEDSGVPFEDASSLAGFLFLSLMAARGEAAMSKWKESYWLSRGDTEHPSAGTTGAGFERRFNELLSAHPDFARDWEASGLRFDDLFVPAA